MYRVIGIPLSLTTTGLSMYVSVRDNNIDQALRVLKKKMQREGMFREMKTEELMKNLQKEKLEKWLKAQEELGNL